MSSYMRDFSLFAFAGLRPCPVSSSVGWMGIQENTWALEGLQSLYIPAQVVPQKKAGGMTLRKRKAAAANNANAQAYSPDDESEKPRKRVRTTRASQRAKAALAAATPTPAEAEAEEQEQASSSLLFPSGAAAPDVDEALTTTTAVSALDGAQDGVTSRDVKQEFIATTPVLQAIGLMLELPCVASADLLPPPAVLSTPPPLPPSSSSNTAEATPARRSTRTRRKPAPPGPCSLVSTPLSALDTPLPSAEPALGLGLGLADPETPESGKRVRSGSRGSSTAVSDGGYPSEEGTVVDAEIGIGIGIEAADEESPCGSKGKRKAVEIELAEGGGDDFEPEPEAEPEEEDDDERRPEPAKTPKSRGSRRAPAAKRRKTAAGAGGGGGRRKTSRRA